MIAGLGTAVALVLLLLSGLHVYWLLGGRIGKDVSLPESEGQPAFRPGAVGTAAVAVALLAAAGVIALRAGVVELPVSDPLVHFGTWAVAAAFLLRAIGDFRYVGLFRRVRGTRFARWDARLYTPLALGLGIGAAVIAHSAR